MIYLELEEPVRSFEWVDDRLLHDGVRTVRPDEDGVVAETGNLCWIADAANAAAAAELLLLLLGSRSTNSKK